MRLINRIDFLKTCRKSSLAFIDILSQTVFEELYLRNLRFFGINKNQLHNFEANVCGLNLELFSSLPVPFVNHINKRLSIKIFTFENCNFLIYLLNLRLKVQNKKIKN